MNAAILKNNKNLCFLAELFFDFLYWILTSEGFPTVPKIDSVLALSGLYDLNPILLLEKNKERTSAGKRQAFKEEVQALKTLPERLFVFTHLLPGVRREGDVQDWRGRDDATVEESLARVQQLR